MLIKGTAQAKGRKGRQITEGWQKEEGKARIWSGRQMDLEGIVCGFEKNSGGTTAFL